jgi:hypothetical protein
MPQPCPTVVLRCDPPVLPFPPQREAHRRRFLTRFTPDKSTGRPANHEQSNPQRGWAMNARSHSGSSCAGYPRSRANRSTEMPNAATRPGRTIEIRHLGQPFPTAGFVPTVTSPLSGFSRGPFFTSATFYSTTAKFLSTMPHRFMIPCKSVLFRAETRFGDSPENLARFASSHST